MSAFHRIICVIFFVKIGLVNTAMAAGQCTIANTHDSNLIAVTWLPGFCHHHPNGKQPPECQALRQGKLKIDHLTLHGLWPNKQSCGVTYGKCQGPKMDLTPNTLNALKPWMPSFYYSDGFARHEWRKHGTCQSLDDDDYFMLSLNILKKIDGSPIGEFVKAHRGLSFMWQDFKQHIQQTLGKDFAGKVQIMCAGNSQLQEIKVNLPRNINAGLGLSAMVIGAPKFNTFVKKCGAKVSVQQ